MLFKRITFSWLSPMVGVHVGRNPVSGQRFVHVAPVPFVGLDFELPPYGLNEQHAMEAELNGDELTELAEQVRALEARLKEWEGIEA